MTAACDILVVEDDPMIALDLEAELERFGTVGLAGSVAQALAAIERRAPLAAVMDFNLGDETSEPAARRLHELGVPFLMLSGAPARVGRRLGWTGAPILAKPAWSPQVARALADLAGLERLLAGAKVAA